MCVAAVKGALNQLQKLKWYRQENCTLIEVHFKHSGHKLSHRAQFFRIPISQFLTHQTCREHELKWVQTSKRWHVTDESTIRTVLYMHTRTGFPGFLWTVGNQARSEQMNKTMESHLLEQHNDRDFNGRKSC